MQLTCHRRKLQHQVFYTGPDVASFIHLKVGIPHSDINLAVVSPHLQAPAIDGFMFLDAALSVSVHHGIVLIVAIITATNVLHDIRASIPIWHAWMLDDGQPRSALVPARASQAPTIIVIIIGDHCSKARGVTHFVCVNTDPRENGSYTYIKQ